MNKPLTARFIHQPDANDSLAMLEIRDRALNIDRLPRALRVAQRSIALAELHRPNQPTRFTSAAIEAARLQMIETRKDLPSPGMTGAGYLASSRLGYEMLPVAAFGLTVAAGSLALEVATYDYREGIDIDPVDDMSPDQQWLLAMAEQLTAHTPVG